MADIDTSGQAPVYTPPNNYDAPVDTETTSVESRVIQTNGDVTSDTQAPYASAVPEPETGTEYITDASLPKLDDPTDTRVQVSVSQSQEPADTDTDIDTATAGSETEGTANGEEPNLFVEVQDPEQNPSGEGGEGENSGTQTQAGGRGQAIPEEGEAVSGQITTRGTLGTGDVEGAQTGAPVTSSSGPSDADLQQFNPDLPANDPFAPDPASDFTDAAATLFGTDYTLGEGGGNEPIEEAATPPLAGDPNSSVLPDGTVLTLDGEQVVVDSSLAATLGEPIIVVDDAFTQPAVLSTGTQRTGIGFMDPAEANLVVLRGLENSLVSMTDVLLAAEELAKQLPDSPEKATFLNFLKSVSANLLALSEMLYQLQIINTEQSRQATQAQKDAAIHDIKERAKAEQKRLKAESKKRKKAKFGILNKIFSFVKLIFMAIAVAMLQMIPGLGQLASAYIIAAMVDEVCKTFGINYSCTQALTNAIADAVVGMMPYLSEAAKESCRTAVKGICAGMCIAAMLLCPVAFALGGGAAIQATLIDSGIIKDEGLRAKFGMALGVAQAVAGIILAIAMCCIPGGQGAAFGMLTSVAGTTTARMADILLKVLNVVMATVTITGEVNQALIADLTRQIAKIRGAYESSQALIQMLIQLLKQAIKTLQDGIKEFAAQIAGVQGALQANFSNLSAQLGALYNAT